MYELRWFLIPASGDETPVVSSVEEEGGGDGTNTGATGGSRRNPLREKFDDMVVGGHRVHAMGHQSRTDTYIYIRPQGEPGGDGDDAEGPSRSSCATTKPPDYGLKFRGASMERREYLRRLRRRDRSLELKIRLDERDGDEGDEGGGGVGAELYYKYEYPSMEGVTRALVLRGLLDEGRRRDLLTDGDDAGGGVVLLPIRKKIWKAPVRVVPPPGESSGRCGRRRRTATVTVEYDELFLPPPPSSSSSERASTAAESSMIVYSFNVEGEDESDVYRSLGGHSGIEEFRSNLVALAAIPPYSTIIEGGYPALVHWYVENHHPREGQDDAAAASRGVVVGGGGGGEREEGSSSSVHSSTTASRLVFDDADDDIV